MQRADLNPLEEAEGYRTLMEDYSHTQDDIAKMVGKSRSHVANTLRLLKLPPSIAMLAPIFIGIFGAIAGILGGLCADRFGRFAINVLPRVLLIILAFPALYVIVAAGTGWVFLAAISVLTVLHMACTALLNMVVAEALPPSVRAMAVSTTYAVGLAIFGGSAQFVATSVVAFTGEVGIRSSPN